MRKKAERRVTHSKPRTPKKIHDKQRPAVRENPGGDPPSLPSADTSPTTNNLDLDLVKISVVPHTQFGLAGPQQQCTMLSVDILNSVFFCVSSWLTNSLDPETNPPCSQSSIYMTVPTSATYSFIFFPYSVAP